MASASSKVTQFQYQAIDRQGKKRQGIISGANASIAKAQLRKQGFSVKKIHAKRESFTLFKPKIKSNDIAIFTRQMATMVKAGVPIVKAFEIVLDGLENQAMKEVIAQVRTDVSSGGGFGAALRKHPKHFDYLFCNLIESGEQSGSLETMLDRIATYREKTESLRRKIRGAMKYPLIVLVIAALVTTLLLVKVVPTFADIFSSFGAELPLPTQVVVSLSNWVISNGFFVLIGLLAGIAAIKVIFERSQRLQYGLQRFSTKLPVFGNIIYQGAMARYARTLSTTFAAGVPLVEALESAAGASGNIIYSTAIRNVKTEVSSGAELNSAMRNEQVFPQMLIQMVAIGEQSGSLDHMLEKAALIYEEEVDTAVDGLTSMMEPLIMAFLGLIVGGLVVSMYLPIFQIGNVV